jgi:hypothetical protein
VDSADREVSLLVCDELLHATVSLRTTEPKAVGVLMAMLVTQLNASATVEGNRWIVFCREAEGPGTLFRRGVPATTVTVPKAPQAPK